MQTFTCAKINLGLNVVSRRADGYHDIETVFYPLPVTDVLEVTDMSHAPHANTPCNLRVTGTSELCAEQDNLVVKAYNLLAQYHPLPHIQVHLHKSIPSQAGMGGGSSDAAYMIRLLNSQFSLGLSTGEMCEYAARLGADCAFFIMSDSTCPQPVYATGIGEQLHPFTDRWDTLDGKWLVLVKPDVAVSTKEAYSGIVPCKPAMNCRDALMMPIETWRNNLTNDFEVSIFKKLPLLADVKQWLYSNGAIYAAMSGSGSTIFGIFSERPYFVTASKFGGYLNVIHLNANQ